MPSRSKQVATIGVLVALAAVFSYIEVLLPVPLGVPGIKLGLANVVIVFALYMMGGCTALTISVIRIVLVSAMFGNIMMALYSIAGALVSLLIMALLKKSGCFSIIGVSMAGGVFHNVAQLAVAIFASGTLAILAYLPVLIVVGMLTGILIGIVTRLALYHLTGSSAVIN